MRGEWRVRIVEHGRDGEVIYEEGGRALSFYWEFGGGNVVTSVSVGDDAEWRAHHGWAADRRAEIIARVTGEVIRQRAPTCRGEMDASGRFLNFIADDAPSPQGGSGAGAEGSGQSRGPKAAATDFVWRLNQVKSRMAGLVLILTILAGAGLLAGRTLFTVKTTGTPAGASARAGEFIATPIGRLEPYVPSLDRNHGRDRYSMILLIHSVRDATNRRIVRVAGGLTGSDLAKSRIAGVAGSLVWFDAPETVVIDAETSHRLSAEDAARAPQPPRPVGAEALAALASAEMRLEGLLAEPGEAGAPRLPAGDDAMFNGAYLRGAAHREALALDGGDFLLVYHTKRYREGVVAVARVNAAGEIVWRAKTPLGRIEEALPDPARPALIGVGPREEGKVPEPLLVVIDASTGSIVSHALLVL